MFNPASGFVAPGFEAVYEAFCKNLQSGTELGAAYAVMRDGELIVDLWGGHSELARKTPLARDALFNLWSVTKGLAALCIALLVERGALAYDSRVAQYWPAFGERGKRFVTVGQLMSHQAGLCGAAERVTIEDYFDHEKIVALLAAQAPFFEPGSAWGYHPLSFGPLADELVRCADGRTIRQFFAEEVAAPLGVEAYLGLPAREDSRQLRTIPPVDNELLTFEPPNPQAYRAALENPLLDAQWPNRRDWRAAGIAAAGGSASARALARIYGLMARGGELDGTRLLSERVIQEATLERVRGINQISGLFGGYAAGFVVNMDRRMGPSPEAFGHPGWGGNIAFADPKAKLGVAYLANQMGSVDPLIDPRSARLIEATYGALASFPASAHRARA